MLFITWSLTFKDIMKAWHDIVSVTLDDGQRFTRSENNCLLDYV